MNVTYVKGSDLPDLAVRWEDSSGDPIDMSTGWTFEMKVGVPGSDAEFTKTSGFTGTATGVTVQWATSGELNTLTRGVRMVQVTATRTSDSRERIQQFGMSVIEAII